MHRIDGPSQRAKMVETIQCAYQGGSHEERAAAESKGKWYDCVR